MAELTKSGQGKQYQLGSLIGYRKSKNYTKVIGNIMRKKLDYAGI